MFVYGHNNRGRARVQQNQKPLPKQNVRTQKINLPSNQDPVLQGMQDIKEILKTEMDGMRNRLSNLESKNELVLQQNRDLAQNGVRYKEMARMWKAKAEERLMKYNEALNRVLQLIENNKDLRQQNEDLRKQKVDFDDRMRILIDRNKIFEDGIKVIITEHTDVQDELMKFAIKSGIADDFEAGILDDEDDKDDQWANQRRDNIKGAMVLAYVASKMTG